MPDPAPDHFYNTVSDLVEDRSITAAQKIVRETKFYKETIAPLIIGSKSINKPIVFIEERTTTNSGTPTDSKVSNYYQEMHLVANLAGHGDFFKDRKIIFIINEGDYHWTTSVKEKNDDTIVSRIVTTDGTCGLSSALIACNEILGESTSASDKTKYQSAIGELRDGTSDNASILSVIPPNKKSKVQNLLNNRSKLNWLETDDIRDIIIANEGNNSQLLQSHNSSNAQNRKNQINFATALNNPDLNSYKGDFSDLLPSGIDHYRSVQSFYEELDQKKLKDFLAHHSQLTDLNDSKKINLYRICEQYSFFQDGDKKIKHGFGTFNGKAEIDQEISLFESQREKEREEERKNKQILIGSSKIAIKYFEETFDKDKYKKHIEALNSFNEDRRFDEKLLISLLLHNIRNFEVPNKEDLHLLPQNILEIIVPKSCQPDTQNYKGWGKVINSKTENGKTTLELDGKKIDSIEIDGEDKLKKILELKNPFLINCAILDLFRNTDDKDITVKFTNPDLHPEEPFLHGNRKTIIDNKIVDNPTAEQINSLTETYLDVAKRIYDQKILGQEKPPKDIPDDFENIKKHIEERFKILEEQLSVANSNKIIVIPGSYDDKGNFKHALGTLRAVGQWGNKIYSDEIKDIIEQKIATLRVSNPGKIFFGNIGTEVVEDGDRTFYPQFPVGAQTWDDFEKNFRANITKISPGEKQALIKNYETNLGLSFSPPAVDDDNKLDAILKHLKTNFTNKNFIHVWGANAKNWNSDIGQWGGGGGQATAFKANKDGVFAIATTPVEGTKNLMERCKIYGTTPSAKPSHPKALGIAGAVAEVTAGAA